MVGSLELILGNMGSGKSNYMREQLMRRVIAGNQVDMYLSVDAIRTDDELNISAGRGEYNICVTPVECSDDVKSSKSAVGFDELHFYDERIISKILNLVSEGVDVYACGLDPTFRGEPVRFKGSQLKLYELIPFAEKTVFFNSICTHFDGKKVCGSPDARWVQKYYGDEVAPYDSSLIEKGDIKPCDGVWYAPRCREHFKFYSK